MAVVLDDAAPEEDRSPLSVEKAASASSEVAADRLSLLREEALYARVPCLYGK